MTSQALWYLSRGSGAVLLVVLTLVLMLGVVTRDGRTLPGLPRFAVAGVHRNASLLAVGFLAIHVGTAVLDPYVPLDWTAAFVPFTAGYRPFRVGLGALALDALLAVVLTSLLRRRLGIRAWRVVHWLSYAVWPVALVHGFTTGTDLTHGGLLWLTAACVVVVLLAVAWRLTVVASDRLALSVQRPVDAWRRAMDAR